MAKSAVPRFVKKASSRQEKRIATDTGSSAQPGSGCGKWNKSDVVQPGKFRVEAKLTTLDKYSVTRKVLDKITSECAYNEVPFLIVDFMSRDMYLETSVVLFVKGTIPLPRRKKILRKSTKKGSYVLHKDVLDTEEDTEKFLELTFINEDGSKEPWIVASYYWWVENVPK